MTMQRAGLSFYAIMGLVFLAVAVAGFTPNSLAILSGSKTNPPLLIHAHAAVMAAWILLLAIQACLVSTQRKRWHASLGAVSFVLAPVVFMLMLVIALPDLEARWSEPAIFLIQLKRLLVFGTSVPLALALRHRPEAHKRLMFLATFAVLDAAFFRMDWLLPSFGVEHRFIAAHAWQYLLLLAFVANDLRQLGRVHPVFLVGVPIIVGLQSAAALVV